MAEFDDEEGSSGSPERVSGTPTNPTSPDQVKSDESTPEPSSQTAPDPESPTPEIAGTSESSAAADDATVEDIARLQAEETECGPLSLQEEPEPCPPCDPNDDFIAPDWTKLGEDEPFLHEKVCQYWITITCDEKGTSEGTSEGTLEALIEKYREHAVRMLFRVYDKKETDDAVEAIKMICEGAPVLHGPPDTNPLLGAGGRVTSAGKSDRGWYLPSKELGRIRILYVVTAYNFDQIPDSVRPEEEEPGKKVIFLLSDSNAMFGRLHKSLDVFAGHQAYWHQQYKSGSGGGQVYKKDSAEKLYLGKLATRVRKFRKALAEFADDNDWSWYGTGIFTGEKNPYKIKIGFEDDFTIKYVKCKQAGCGWRTLRKRKAKFLRSKGVSDKMVCAMVANIHEIDRAVTARSMMPWLEFVQKFIYPQPDINYGTDPNASNSKESSYDESCTEPGIFDDLANLPDAIMDEVCSLPDMIADRFNQQLCMAVEGIEDRNEALGWGDVVPDDLYQSAVEAAFDEYLTDDWLMSHIAEILEEILLTGNADEAMEVLWEELLEKMTVCGLIALLMRALRCLMAGIPLEDAMMTMVEAALNAMGIDNLEELFIGLPPDKQQEIKAYINQRFAGMPMPWEAQYQPGNSGYPDNAAIAAGKKYEEEEGKPPPESTDDNNQRRGQLDDGEAQGTIGAAMGDVQAVIMEAYLSALLDVVGAEALLAELNKFPGAEIIAGIIEMFDCPYPPLFEPGLFDFMKTLELDFCNGNYRLALPRLSSFPFPDIWAILVAVIKRILKELIVRILVMILVTIIRIILDALCKLLELTGRYAAELGKAMVGAESDFAGVWGDTFCGSDLPKEQLDDAITQAFGAFGILPSPVAGQQGSPSGAQGTPREGRTAIDIDTARSMNTDEATKQLIETLGLTLTRGETIALLNGDATDATASMVHEAIRYENPEFAAVFDHPERVHDLFSAMGAMIPPQIRAKLNAEVRPDLDFLDLPLNSSMCATPAALEEFADARKQIMAGRATPEEIDEQFRGMQNRAIDDLGDLAKIQQLGPNELLRRAVQKELEGTDCKPGLLDQFRNSAPAQAIMSSADGTIFESIEQAFVLDLVGPSGYLSMVLSDTHGAPWYRHHQTANSIWPTGWAHGPRESWTAWFGFPDESQGHFPKTVAKHMQNELKNLRVKFKSTTAGDPKKPDAIFEYKDNNGGNGGWKIGMEIEYLHFRKYDGEISRENEYRIRFLRLNNLGAKQRPPPRHPEDWEPGEGGSGVRRSEVLDVTGITRTPRDVQDVIDNNGYLPPLGTSLTVSPQAHVFGEHMRSVLSKAMPGMSEEDLRTNVEKFRTDIFDNINERIAMLVGEAAAGDTDSSAFDFGYRYNTKKIKSHHLDPDHKPKHPRVHFLDPEIYGGTEERPPVYVEPRTRPGWLGITDSLIPELDGCDPKREMLVRLGDIKDHVSEVRSRIKEDPRLNFDPQCVKEIPFHRILNKGSHAQLEGIVMATIRVVIAKIMLESLPFFTKFEAKFPEVYDDSLLAYLIQQVVQKITRYDEDGESDYEFRWLFLEQCVQIYSRRVKLGDIEEVPADAEAAMSRIREAQKAYKYPFDEDDPQLSWPFTSGKKRRHNPPKPLSPGFAVGSDGHINWFENLFYGDGKYQFDKKLKFIAKHERDAKLIARYVIESELETMGQIIADTLKPRPQVSNLKKYFLGTSGWCQGSTLKVDLPTVEGEKLPFPGDTLSVAATADDNPLDDFKEMLVEDDFINVALPGLDWAKTSKFEKGQFILEKYILIKEKPQDPLTTSPLRQSVVERDGHLYGVVSLDEWSRYIRRLIQTDPSLGSKYISELWGTQSVERDEEGDQSLTGDAGWKYGLRLSYVPPEDFVLEGDEDVLAEAAEHFKAFGLAAPKGATMHTVPTPPPDENNRPYGHEYYTTPNMYSPQTETFLTHEVEHKHENARYIIPLATTEDVIVDHRLDEFDINDEEYGYDMYCMVDKLIEETDFKLVFDYCIPIPRMLSLLTMYCSYNWMASIGEDDGWKEPKDRVRDQFFWGDKSFEEWNRRSFPNAIAQCRRVFMGTYKSDDFTFEEPSYNSGGRQLWHKMFPGTGADLDELSWWDKLFLRKRPFNKDGGGCDE